LIKNDEQLKGLDFVRFATPANDKVIETTVESLKKKGFNATVVANRDEALKTLQSLIPKGSSVNIAGSQSLGHIGFTDLLQQILTVGTICMEKF